MKNIIAGFRSNNKVKKRIATIYYSSIVVLFMIGSSWKIDDLLVVLILLITPSIVLNFMNLLTKDSDKKSILCLFGVYTIILCMFSYIPTEDGEKINNIEVNNMSTYKETELSKKIGVSFDKERKKINSFLKDLEKDKYEITFLGAEVNDILGFTEEYQVTLNNNSKIHYYGNLKNNKPHGIGLLIIQNSGAISQYIGNFKNGVYNGYGIAEYGIYSYEGNYKDGKPNGSINKFYSSEISIIKNTGIISVNPQYVGELKFFKADGKGTLYDENGNVKYDGKFKKGKYDGKGILYFNNGDIKYKGEFKNGRYDGKGTLYDENGNVKYKGRFKKGDIK